MSERGTSYEGAPLPGRPLSAGSGERRVALVIGNSSYPAGPLRNPRNDAEAFAAKLREMHPSFDVSLALDVGRNAMEDALEAFEAKLGDCDTALLFFAGHGLQVKGINFLMPVDADIRQEIHLRRRAFSLNEVLEIMGRRVRSSSLVFLDACRDNPFARSLLSGLPEQERGRFLTRSGLAEVRAATGSFIAFATAPDNVAHDGTGRNSPFTEALLTHMATPGLSINDVMIAVRRDVVRATSGRQEPWDQSSLRQRFCFNEQQTLDTEIETAQSAAASTPGSPNELKPEQHASRATSKTRTFVTLGALLLLGVLPVGVFLITQAASSCVRHPQDASRASEIVEKYASLLSSDKGNLYYRWEGGVAGNAGLPKEFKIIDIFAHDGKLLVRYDWQSGVLELSPAVLYGSAPVVYFQGAWRQNNGRGCMQLGIVLPELYQSGLTGNKSRVAEGTWSHAMSPDAQPRWPAMIVRK